MSEYIEREKVYEIINASLNEIPKLKELFSEDYIRGCQTTLGIVTSDIQNVPAADVAPVVHGHWEYDSETFNICSACKRRLDDMRGYKYCPVCGAKMDEEEKPNEENM